MDARARQAHTTHLVDSLFDGKQEPMAACRQLLAQLHPTDVAVVQSRLRVWLRQTEGLGAETAAAVSCVMYRTGFPAARILRFLSLYAQGSMGAATYEYVAATIFPQGPPLDAALLYDLTQYVYLEGRLLARRAMEISSRLAASAGPEVLLFLFLLTLRNDLSNENLRLVVLVMRECAPGRLFRTRIEGKAPGQPKQGLVPGGKQGKSHQAAGDESAADVQAAAAPFDRQAASAFLDRYFSDAALAAVHARGARATERLRPGTRQATARAVSAEVPIARPRARDRDRTRSARVQSPSTPVPSQDRVAAATPRPAAQVRRRAKGTPATVERPRIPRAHRGAGDAVDSPAQPAPRARLHALGAAAAFVMAAAVSIHLALRLPPPPVDASQPPDLDSITAPHESAPRAVEEQPALPTVMQYEVRTGDSLWRIYLQVNGSPPEPSSWLSFLAAAQALNDLRDPDRLRPGTVLTLTAPAP